MPQARASLAAFFWPETSQQAATTSLRVELSKLKAYCGDLVDIGRETVSVAKQARVAVDATELQRASAAGQYQLVVHLYRGPFLRGFDVAGSAEFDSWRGWQQERFQRLVLESLHSLTADALLRNRFDEALTSTRRWLEIFAYDERAHQYTMMSLARSGRRADALAEYESCRSLLHKEMGIKPTESTRALCEAIRKGELGEVVLVRTPSFDLPQPPTSFVGRGGELAELSRQLTDTETRLATLVGPGGVGKTRLALQAARGVLDLFPDGVFFVPIGSVETPHFLLSAMASAFGFAFDTLGSGVQSKDQLMDYLAPRKLLVVLDGFEGLLEAAGMLGELVTRAPHVRLLVTSRERLRVQGEWVMTLDGLPVPADLKAADPGDALALFEARATQVREGRGLTPDERQGAIRICSLVQGLPRAIELAAVWVRALSCSDIAHEIEHDLDFLVSDSRDATPAHRSLWAVFNHSWSALTAEQQTALQGLSVFQGGFERAAAQAVCSADAPMLLELIDKSLIRRNALNRFDMHPAIQRYALDSLHGDAQALYTLRQRHSRFYRSWMGSLTDDILGVAMQASRRALAPEMGNLRAAMEWSVLHEPSNSALPALADYFSLFIVKAWGEGRDAFAHLAEAILETNAAIDEAAAGRDPCYPSARARQAFFASNLGWIEESDAVSRACLDGLNTFGMGEELSICLHNLGVNAGFRGEFDQSVELLEKAIRLGSPSRTVAWPSYYIWLGHTWYQRGEYEKSRQALQEGQRLFIERGSPWGGAFALSKLGLVMEGTGLFEKAIDCQRQALEVFHGYSDRVGQAYCLSRMSVDAYALGDYEHAVECAQQGFEIFREAGHRLGLQVSRCRLGFAYLGQGRRTEAGSVLLLALKGAQEHDLVPTSLYALTGLAACLAQEGKRAQAGELLSLVQSHPQTLGLYLELARRWLADVEAAPRSGTSGDLDAVAESLLAGAPGP